MFARLTRYKMRRGQVEDAVLLMNDLRDQIMALPGMIQFINVLGEDGMGYVVSIIETEAQANAHTARAAAMWAQFAPHMELMPSTGGYDVLANWHQVEPDDHNS